MKLSQNIRAFRRERALTQEQLAQALNVTAGAVYKWEAGLSTPDISLIVELADFFDTSVDVLLGYEVKNNRRETAAARLKDFVYRRDMSGLAEADKLLVRYPNCFEIVYESAAMYWIFGFMRRDKALLRRSIELMERACLLIGQNTDPEISELSIHHTIAKAYFSMGESEKAVELFMRDNPRGAHNDWIGYILGAEGEHPGEAIPYLSRALFQCTTSLARTVYGYFHACFRQGDYSAAAGILRFGLGFFSSLKKPGQTGFMDKSGAEWYVYLAETQLRLRDADGARDSLRAAKALAEQFDRAPDYSASSIRFFTDDRPAATFDNVGDFAMECVVNLVNACPDETLAVLWRETAAEEGREDE